MKGRIFERPSFKMRISGEPIYEGRFLKGRISGGRLFEARIFDIRTFKERIFRERTLKEQTFATQSTLPLSLLTLEETRSHEHFQRGLASEFRHRPLSPEEGFSTCLEGASSEPWDVQKLERLKTFLDDPQIPSVLMPDQEISDAWGEFSTPLKDPFRQFLGASMNWFVLSRSLDPGRLEFLPEKGNDLYPGRTELASIRSFEKYILKVGAAIRATIRPDMNTRKAAWEQVLGLAKNYDANLKFAEHAVKSLDRLARWVRTNKTAAGRTWEHFETVQKRDTLQQQDYFEWWVLARRSGREGEAAKLFPTKTLNEILKQTGELQLNPSMSEEEVKGVVSLASTLRRPFRGISLETLPIVEKLALLWVEGDFLSSGYAEPTPDSDGKPRRLWHEYLNYALSALPTGDYKWRVHPSSLIRKLKREGWEVDDEMYVTLTRTYPPGSSSPLLDHFESMLNHDLAHTEDIVLEIPAFYFIAGGTRIWLDSAEFLNMAAETLK